MHRAHRQNISSLLRPLAIALLLFTFLSIRGDTRPIYDFDGDGKTDFIVKRQNGPGTQLQWFIMQSRDGFAVQNWGYQFQSGLGAGDNNGFGDFDGDGKWDITV